MHRNFTRHDATDDPAYKLICKNLKQTMKANQAGLALSLAKTHNSTTINIVH